MRLLAYWLLVLLAIVAIFYSSNKTEASGTVYPNWIVVDHPDTPKEFTEALFKEDAQHALPILKAESGFDCDTVQYRNPGSTAKGCFQILDGTWKDPAYGCTGYVFDFRDNIRCAKKIFDVSGTTPWDASKHVWGYTR